MHTQSPDEIENTHARSRQTTRRWPAAVIGLIGAVSISGGLVGCNAVDGAGEDLQEASENVEQQIDS